MAHRNTDSGTYRAAGLIGGKTWAPLRSALYSRSIMTLGTAIVVDGERKNAFTR
jgi:hypothetical protein